MLRACVPSVLTLHSSNITTKKSVYYFIHIVCVSMGGPPRNTEVHWVPSEQTVVSRLLQLRGGSTGPR